MALLATALYIAILTAALLTGKRKSLPGQNVRPYVTFAVGALLVLTLLAQLCTQSFLAAVERQGDQLSTGQWWRLLTALFGQDGGLGGGAFNILLLLVLGRLAEPFLGWRRWLFLYFGTGILAQLAGLYLQPIGAGNSVDNFGLAAGILVRYAVLSKNIVDHIPLAIAAISAVILIVVRDIHGAAFLIGCLLAAVVLIPKIDTAQPR